MDSSPSASRNYSAGDRTAVETWLKRRDGKRLWFTFTAIFAACLVGGIALLLAGQAVPGLILIAIVALMVVTTVAFLIAGTAFLLLRIVWALIAGSWSVEEMSFAGLPSDMAMQARKMEQVRMELSQAARKPTWIGFAIGAVLAAWFTYGIVTSTSPNYWAIPIVCLLLPIGGACVGAAPAQAKFRDKFKTDLIPIVLARHGQFRAVPSDAQPDFTAAQSAGVMWRHHRLRVDDGYVGTYRDYPVEIYDLGLWRGDAIFRENTRKRAGTRTARVAFRIEMARQVPATLAVTDKSGLLEDARSQDPRLQPVQTDDALFEKLYAVHATDQSGARRMLTPALMQRMLGVANNTGFSPPSLLVDGKSMLMVMQYAGSGNLFEPMDINDNLGRHLIGLEQQTRAIFSIIDAMIEMAEVMSGPRDTGADSSSGQ